MKYLTLTVSIAALAVAGAASVAQAEIVREKTIIKTQDLPGVQEINFSVFDLNQDGVYTKPEVGTQLFYVFDRDGNEVIDNREWEERSLYTIRPMIKETYRFVDKDEDGLTDEATYDFDTFYEASGLIRFDNNKNGLSPEEFIGVGYQKLDDNDNNVIEIEEWEKAYIAAIPFTGSANSKTYN